MKIKTKKTIFGSFILVLVLLLTNLASAAQIGISPSQIQFNNVLRGGYAERTVTISTDSESTTKVEIEPWGNISEWLNFSETEFELTRDEPYILTISTTPPADTPNGNYTNQIRVRTTQEGNSVEEGQAASTVLPVLDLYTVVEVTDQEFLDCRAGAFSVNSVEEGDDIVFTTTIRNLGNIWINPEIRIDIWDINQLEILRSETFTEATITPTTEQEISMYIDSTGLELGQYWVEATAIECYASQTLTFDVLEEGALRAAGTLAKILSNPWIKVGDTTLIQALFTNTGEKDVEASFKGSISREGRTIQLLENDEKITVPMGADEVFEFFFTPQAAGRYAVSGRVFYDSKKTFEKTAIINVEPNGITFGAIIKWALYALVVAGIVFLLLRIRKEKQAYKIKLKRLMR